MFNRAKYRLSKMFNCFGISAQITGLSKCDQAKWTSAIYKLRQLVYVKV